jgi:hypothetical protein
MTKVFNNILIVNVNLIYILYDIHIIYLYYIIYNI